jgi:hypothetical protein
VLMKMQIWDVMLCSLVSTVVTNMPSSGSSSPRRVFCELLDPEDDSTTLL